MRKKKEFEEYLTDWVPVICKAGLSKEQNGTIFEKTIYPLIVSCEKRKLTSYCHALLKSVDLSLIFSREVSLAKLAVTDKAD